MSVNSKIRDFFSHPGYRRFVTRKIFQKFGYRFDNVVRVVCIDEWKQYLATLPLGNLTALEISPADVSHWRDTGFRTYRSVQYPEFDITKEILDQKFDVIIADNVFEHLRDPYQAGRNVLTMLADGGVFLLTTPFLIRIHGSPSDYTRWTPEGLQAFLQECGFSADVRSWGNRKVVISNLAHWRSYGWGLRANLRNEPDFPATVWAYARRAGQPLPGVLSSN